MECLTFLKSKPATVSKLHEAMTKDLYEGMNADLEVMLADGNLSDGLGKVKKLLLETTATPEHIAWYVIIILFLDKKKKKLICNKIILF